MSTWLYDYMDLWLYGFMAIWICTCIYIYRERERYGCTDAWVLISLKSNEILRGLQYLVELLKGKVTVTSESQ